MQTATDQRRQIVRMAIRLRERFLRASQLDSIPLPTAQWSECQRLSRLYEIALRRGWSLAAMRLRPQLEKCVRNLETLLSQTVLRWTPPRPRVSVSLRELYGEVASLFVEFANVDLNVHKGIISVVTDPVILEGVFLGPFRIELDLNGDLERPTYSITAIEPNPAAADEDVTHPHVRDDCLCEGEGILPIRRALDQGRLGDFCQIVNQVLHTYNPGSAYIELDEWEGMTCESCGDSVHSDERTRCHRTSETVCLECAVTCHECDYDYAPDCVETCGQCDEEFCTECLDEGFCRACREEDRLQEIAQNTEPSPAEMRLVASDGRSAVVETPSALEPIPG